jgi:hypothetical protein
MWRTFTVISLVAILAAVWTGCGDGTSTPTPVPPPPPKSAVPTPTVLRTLYRVVVNADRMTTIGPNERSSYPLEGQVYYVPDQSANGRSTLNRLVNSSGTDHADATGSLNGYTQDVVLGFPWSSASVPGVAQLTEAFDSTTGDYALLSPSETLTGYNARPLTAYGYPRSGNASEMLLSLSVGGATVESNEIAGGTTWRWFWNGVQFLNHADYGREIQGAFYYPPGQDLNPNEAGDGLTFSDLDPSIRHGSPVLQFANQGTTQVTRAVPLNWDPAIFGGDQDHPVIWDSLVLGKDLTLNFNNLGAVAKYTTHLVIPIASRGTLADPAGYLLSSFKRYWTYDARSKTLSEVTLPDGCPALTNNSFGGYALFVDFGGIIMSDASGTNAMGVYGVSIAHGGSLSYFAMWKFFCWGDGPSETASDTTAWSAVTGNGTDVLFPAGESTYNVYLITDSVQNVTTRMDDLFQLGVK